MTNYRIGLLHVRLPILVESVTLNAVEPVGKYQKLEFKIVTAFCLSYTDIFLFTEIFKQH